MQDPLAGLDADQRAAVTTASTLVAVIAGAGSGKTRVLTSRITHRIDAGTAEAAHTLALTFTREAAGELRRRLRTSGVRDHVEAGTFHSVCLGLLRQRWRDLDRPQLVVTDDPAPLLASVAGAVPTATLATELAWASARGVDAARYVEAARAAGRRSAVPAHKIAVALTEYATLKRRRGVVDLDDLLSLTAAELVQDPMFAEVVRWRFRHVLVDEAQDLNPVQFRLLRSITERDLYLVGDPAQAIFGFNGADPTLLARIDDRLDGVEVIRLPANHRSTPQIVAAGDHVLRGLDGLDRARAVRPDGAEVRTAPADDEHQEAALVATVLRSLDPGDVRHGRVAVLARTHQQLRRLEDVVRRAGVAVRRGGVDGAASGLVRHIAQLPTASRLREWALETLDDPANEAASALASAVLDFVRQQPDGDGVALRAWLASAPGPEGVELLTFHAAKGREWPIVIVTGVETGLVPHRSATTVSARTEEARLLHVALTRAEDRLVITWARRRNGYSRRPSPLIDGLDTTAPADSPMPDELRPAAPDGADRLVAVLHAWRAQAARAAGVLPAELCSDGELAAIAAARPETADALAEVTGMGPLTATRLFPALREALS